MNSFPFEMYTLGHRGICASVTLYEGLPKIHIRKHFKNEQGKLVPTKHGITLNADEWANLKSFKDIIDAELHRVQGEAHYTPPTSMPTISTGDF